MAFDWLAFVKDAGIVAGVLALSLLFNAWWLRKAIEAANERINTAADTIAAVNQTMLKREQRCEQCEAKYDHILEGFSSRCNIPDCPGLSGMRQEIKDLRKELEHHRDMLGVVTNEFSEMSSKLLAIIARVLGLHARTRPSAKDKSQNEDPDSGEWFTTRPNRD